MKELANPSGHTLDLKTTAVIVLMVAGLPAVMWAHHAAHLKFGVALVIASLLMNLSFTAWHEASHASLSSIRSVNNVFGFISSLASVYPGYFARRREHLVHHKWEGQPGKDPVYPRIQATFWSFPFVVMRVAIAREPWDIPAAFQPITGMQRASDLVSNLLALAITVGAIWLGFGVEVLGLWILPRAIVFWLHAYYICFFPHQIPQGGYQLYRIRPSSFWLRFLTVDQALHGIHHRWPFVPWHRYAAALRKAKDRLGAEGIETV